MTGLVAVVGALLIVNVLFAVTVVLLRVRSNFRAKRFGRIESVWDPVIIGVVSGDDRPVPPIRESDVDHVLQISGRFARRLRGPDREKVQAFAAPIVGRLIGDLSARSAETRAAAVELLGVLALDTHDAFIVDALDDPSQRVSLVAARALLQPEGSEHMFAVLDQLHRYSTWSPSLIASMLAHAGTGALPELRDYLGDASRPTAARAVVAGALRLLHDPQGADIAAGLLDSGDPELVVASLRLIDTVGSSPHADAVRRLIDHDAFFVRSEVATVLGHIGDVSDVEAIARMATLGSPWVAIRSARALLDLGQLATLEDLSRGEGLAADSAREVLEEARAT
jgi:HEAT repeat protein